MASEKRHRVVVYVNEELKLRAEKKSDQLGLSLSGLFNVAISDYLKQDTVIEMAEMFKKLYRLMKNFSQWSNRVKIMIWKNSDKGRVSRCLASSEGPRQYQAVAR